MLASFARAALGFKARLHKAEPVINILETLATAKRILVCMPKDLEEFGIARHLLPRLGQCFPDTRVTLVLKRDFQGLLDEPNCNLLPYSNAEVSLWGLPTRQFLNKVKATRPEVALELNDSFQLFSTALIGNSGAALRICLEEKRRDLFFNFQVRTARTLDLRRRYENLFSYLATPLSRASSTSSAAL